MVTEFNLCPHHFEKFTTNDPKKKFRFKNYEIPVVCKNWKKIDNLEYLELHTSEGVKYITSYTYSL